MNATTIWLHFILSVSHNEQLTAEYGIAMSRAIRTNFAPALGPNGASRYPPIKSASRAGFDPPVINAVNAHLRSVILVESRGLMKAARLLGPSARQLRHILLECQVKRNGSEEPVV